MQEVEQRRSSCRGNRTTEELSQAIVIVRLEGEVAVIEVADQPALTFEMAADALAQAMDEGFEFGFGRRLDPMKAQTIIGHLGDPKRIL